MMPLVAALEGVIAVVVVAVASVGIELCAIRDGKEAGSSEADVTASMRRVSATEIGTEGKTFSVINCEGNASVAKSRVGAGSMELAVASKVKTPTLRSRLQEVRDGSNVGGGTDGDTDDSAVVSMNAAETKN